jgi:hypothetical protein
VPYIKPERRHDAAKHPQNCGELNYAITALILTYLEGNSLSYQLINDVVGALEGAKLEFAHRVIRPYEVRKMLENGDVYLHD